MMNCYRLYCLSLFLLLATLAEVSAQKKLQAAASIFPKQPFIVLKGSTLQTLDSLPQSYTKDHRLHLHVGEARYTLNEVDLYQLVYDPKRPYAYLYGVIHTEKSSRPVSLKQQGKLNTFSSGLIPQATYSRVGYAIIPGVKYKEYLYYNEGYGPVKELSYKNLKGDIRGNPGSMAILGQTRGLQILGGGMMVGAGAFLLYVLSRSNELENIETLVLGGLGVGTLGYLSIKIAPSRVKAACKHYSKVRKK